MMKKRLIAMILCCALAVSGCAGRPAPLKDSLADAEPGQPDAQEEQVAQKTPDAQEEQGMQETSDAQGEQGHMENVQFDKVTINSAYEKAAYFLDMVYKSGTPRNTMVSPLSLNMALGLVSGGAQGSTKEELSAYLSREDYGAFAAEYMEYAAQLNRDNTGRQKDYAGGYKSVFEIANSVWVNEDRKLLSDYADKAKREYQAEIASVAFGEADKDDTVKRINGWCDEKTHGLIPSIVTEDAITETLAMILVNSLYFEAPWVETWYVDQDEFTDLNGTKTTQDMLKDTLSVYFENDKATGFSKYYMNGLEFIGILPKQNGDFEVRDLDLSSLLKSRNTNVDVHAGMPKLDFDTTADHIIEILEAQGVEMPFDSAEADFGGLVETDPAENVYISSILQKCKIELDENGTKAAAVTAMALECAMAVEEREEKEVYLNRPFAFMIYDSANDEIVFIGKVVSADA